MSAKKSDKFKKSRGTESTSASSFVFGRSSSRRDRLIDTTNFGLEVVANISEGSDILAPLKAACKTTKLILEVVQTIKDNQEEWSHLTRRLKDYLSAVEHQITAFETYPPEYRIIDKAFSQPLIQYVEFLEDMHDAVVNRQEKHKQSKLGFLKAFTKVKLDAEEIRKSSQDLDDRHRQLMGSLGVFTAIRIQAIERDAKAILTNVDKTAILQLPLAAFVPSSVHSTCLEGTRKAVLETICDWGNDDNPSKPIFWLCDIAGSGKSTVAMTAMESWRNKGVLGGGFFFSISSSEASTTEKLCSTIARNLVRHIPELAPHVAQAVKQNPSIMQCPIKEQFRELITDPLNLRDSRIILVVDAVDECKSASQRRELLETLSTAVQQCENLKIFMTSRPDPVIEGVLGSLSIKAKLEDRLHDVRHPDNIDDIAVYIHQSLNQVLPEDKRQRLIGKANGLFIWASTACRMLNNETTLNTPEDIYDRLISLDQPGVIDEVYDLVFERTDQESYAVLCHMLALLLVAFEPLAIDEMEDLVKHVGVRGSIKGLIKNLSSVLSAEAGTNLIQFRHPTLVEYLRRCAIPPAAVDRKRIYLDIANANGQVASWCLKRLKSRTDGLKFNICQIESSFHLNRQIPDLEARVSKFIPRPLRYASSHWLFHVSGTDDDKRCTLEGEFRDIIRNPYVLYWTEIFSFTRGVPRAIAGLRALTRYTVFGKETRTRMIEIRRFLMAFSVPIQDSAPHIYISALPFSPRKSIIHIEGQREHSQTLTVTQGVEDIYPGLPRILQGHQSWVNAVSFSPDCSRIVSGGEDRTIRLWDADTGQPLGEPLRGHEKPVKAVVFSPDGSQIVSGSDDNTIRRWDADTGEQLGEAIRGHDGPVRDAKLSPDGSRIISRSHDGTIRFWDAVTGEQLGEPFRAFAFSPDGSRIISAPDDKTIRIWDTATGEQLGELLRDDGHGISATAFSPDGSRVVFGYDNSTMRLWDTDTSDPLGEPFRGHEGSVIAISFSPDGSLIVSGSLDCTLRIWDACTGQPLGSPLRGHKSWIRAVQFSRYGSRIVSGSDDSTIRLWDAETGDPLGEARREHGSSIWAVAYSPDGSRIASGGNDHMVRLWDAETGEPLGEPLRGHTDSVRAVEFSLDGLRIVSGSDDCTIRIWDASTGEPLGEPLRGHDEAVRDIKFSRDGSLLVSGSSDSTIRLWDVGTGKTWGEPFRGHRERVWAVEFSPNSSQIVSCSEDDTIRLWDVGTQQALGEPLDGYGVFTVAFSPDGSRIFAGCGDEMIRIWDAETGEPLGEPLCGHEGFVGAIAFSPDGSRLVSGSDDCTIRIWDAKIGKPLGKPLRGHKASISAVVFSPDGSRIVSGSEDDTIQLWDIVSNESSGESSRGFEQAAHSIASSPVHLSADSSSNDGISSKYYTETDLDAEGGRSAEEGEGFAQSVSEDASPDTPPQILVPGFNQCSLTRDGWVQSSGKFLFWVPPDNRHGLQYPHLLTIPKTSPLRATKVDFTRFQCGLSWTNVRKNATS